jgi:hypothetical protein
MHDDPSNTGVFLGPEIRVGGGSHALLRYKLAPTQHHASARDCATRASFVFRTGREPTTKLAFQSDDARRPVRHMSVAGLTELEM